jgi:predicted Zn-dependent peptidase
MQHPVRALPAQLLLVTLLAFAGPSRAADSSAPAPAANPAATAATTAAALPVEIPHRTFTLDNGLLVIFHEDHGLPQVALNLVFGVGSRDEEAGRSGFAHLFEHLMFMGTQRVPRGMYDQWMEEQGGWNNAWTGSDLTDYFDVAPSHALPLLLWMEADRLAALGGQIDAEKLDLQRAVVRNERRQTSEDQPYGKVELRLPELLWPPGHPYHHPVIGSHEDLQAASVDDVRDFFSRWYNPANASLVVAGDFDAQDAELLVRRYFGWIPGDAGKRRGLPTPPDVPPVVAVAETIPDRVELPRVVFAWRGPAAMTDEDAAMDLLGRVLADGKASKLYQSLVHGRQLAQDVAAFQDSSQLGSGFYVWATARDGVPVEKLETALHEELELLRSTGLASEELRRARNKLRREFVEGLEPLNGRAMRLNLYQALAGRPDWAANDLQRYERASAPLVNALARSVLDPARRVTLRVIPDAAGAAGGRE